MVVSEAARSQGKTSNPSEGGSAVSQVAGGSQTAAQINGYYQGGRFMPLRAHMLLALGLATMVGSVSHNAYADSTNIVADRNAAAAQQATILKSSNGTTQVNIQTPSKAGVSRNVFSKFDVGQDGAILNNSRKNAQTQLAGWVEGNPYLARGEARVILNEVNSSDPSRLSGYTEIAGGRAELVIANPAGITCAGCGFINASRTTLTTGQALMEQGKLTGFDVTGGKVRIDGDGMDSMGSDYTQIIAKTAEINAGVYAKNLDVITGSNQVSYEEDTKDTVITSKNAANNSNQTTGVALDVSALGAMYAGKIRLIGTEKGMGVTNAGSIVASAGGLQLDNNGNLINSGSLIANQDKVNIVTKGFDVDNSGTIASSRETATLNSSTLNNSGVLSSRDTLQLQQTGAISNSGEISTGSFDVKAASLNNSGSLLQTGSGKLAIDSSQLINKQGGIIGQDLYPSDSSTPPSVTPSKTPPTTANNGSSVGTNPTSQPSETPAPLPVITRDGNINANNLTNTGSIYSNGKINVATDSVANQDKSSLAVSTLNIADNGSASNTDSRLQLDQIDWQLADFDNTEGQIITNAGINISTNSDIDNINGTLASNGDITLNANGDINNNSGVIQSGAKLTTDSHHTDNSSGKLISQEGLTINSRGDLTNTQGAINSAKNAVITSKSLDNDNGQITAQGSLTTSSDSVNNSGQLYGETDTQVTSAGTINNSGTIASGGNVDMTTGSLTQTDSGSLVAGMSADGTLLDNSANLNILASGDITSQGNHIATGDVSLSGGDISLLDSNTQGSSINTTARTGINTTNASITATDKLTLSSTNGALDNTAGVLSGRVLEIDAQRLNNTDGKLTQTGKQDLTLAMAEGIDNTHGEIASNSDNLTLSTTTLDNSSGKIIHAGTSSNDDNRLTINADSVNNTEGEVLSVGTQTWQIVKNIDNTSGVVQANRFTISAQNLDNTDGRIVAVDTTQAAAKNTASSNNKLQIQESFTNAGIGIVASDTGSLAVTAGEIDNKGQISSVNDLSLKTRTLTNSGSLYSQADVDIVNQGAMSNTGSIAAQGNTSVNTGSLVQSADGQLIAGLNADNTLSNTPSTLRVTSTGTQRNAGTNIATGDIYLQGSSLDLSDGSSQGVSIDMQADDALINKNGVINGDNIALTSKQIDNSTGLIVAAEGLALNTDLLNNEAGDIRHLGASPLTLAIADINNQSGYLGSNSQTLTINSERLNNSKGGIQHSGSGALNISATEQLQGQEGQLITGNILTLSGQDIDLSGASTQAGSIQLTAKTLSNQDGEIILTDKAHDSLIDVQQQLNNIDGRIASQNKQLLIDAGSIDNTTGDIVSENELKANVDQLINEKGLLASKADVLLDISGQLNNQSGLVSSEKNLTISADSFNNDGTLGQNNLGILADNIALNVNTLSNQSGLIEAKEQANISADTSIDNTNGLVASGGSLSITDSNIDNRQLDIINKEGSLVANITNDITARSLSGNGSILSFQDIAVDTVTGFNQSKTMSANGNIVFKTQGDFTNQGIVEAGNSVSITTTKNLENFNKIQSNQEVDLTADNITNHINAKVIANNNDVQAKGTLTNNGSLEGISSLAIGANSLNNSGQIIAEANSGKLTVNVDNTLQNTGLINAGKVTIKSDELLNSEKIFGGDIAIQANRLVNGKDKTAALSNVGGSNTTGGAIASRGDLALAGNTILNEEGALIYAQGGLSVGGSLDDAGNTIGSATLLTNASADIKVIGDASLNANDINNENRYLTTTTKVTQDPNTKVVFSESLESKEYAADEIRLWRTWNDDDPKATQYNDNTSEFFKWFGEIDYTEEFDAKWGIELPDGKQITKHVSKRFKETTSETAVLSSDPGSITIGGNLIFSDNLTNTDSEIIVGGSVNSTNGNSVKNISTEGERVLERNGTQLQYRITRDNNGTFGDSKWESRKDTDDYSDSLKTTFDLDTTTFIKNANVDIAQQDIEQTTISNNDAEAVQDNRIIHKNIINNLESKRVENVDGNTQSPDVKAAKNTDNVAVDINKATLESYSGRQQAINNQNQDTVSVQNNGPLLPTSSLFGINPDSNANYLVEVDPAFSNYNKWLSSDYMLDRLQLDPTVTQKRLGDGFYEQALIRDQIHHLTGNYFLDNNQDDQTQYQMLMDNGLTFAEGYSIRPGIALSAAQVAQLTSDIVWLVEETVTLDDGKSVTALVPKVYLRPEGLQLRPNGSLISAGEGFNVNLSGDFKNVSGVVMGRDVMNISANNIDNISGLLTSDIVNLNAVEDIDNVGGEVRANNVLFATADNDINIESTTQNSNNGKRVNLDRIAGFYVNDELKGRLQATAGQDINLKASNIDNAAEQGSTVLYAGKDINLGTLTTGFSESLYVDEDNQRTVKVSNEVGSNVTAKGSITAIADNDISIRGSNVKSDEGPVGISAGQDVKIENSLSSESVNAKSSYKVSGQLSRSTIKESGAKSREVTNFSNIEGDTVSIQAGRDISLTGTNALSDSGTQLSAGRDVSILAAKNTFSESSSNQEKKKGIFGSEGSTGFTIGKQRTDDSNTKTKTQYASSKVGAIDGNVIIDAGHTYQQTGSNLVAGMGADTGKYIKDANRGNTVVRAQDINIDNNINVTTSQSEQKFKQTGLTVSVSNSLVDNVNAIRDLEEAAGNTGSTRMKGIAAISGLLKAQALAEQAQETLGSIQNGVGNTRIQATIGSQKSQSNSSSVTEVNQGSSITTNNLALIATGGGKDSNIDLIGSDINATSGGYFKADNDFNIDGVAEQQSQSSDNKNSSYGVGGFIDSTGSGGITMNASRGKGDSDGDSTTYANSHLNIGGTTTFDIGNDVNVAGGVANLNHLTGHVGGDVNVTSLQDTATYESNQKQMGISADIDLVKGTNSSFGINGSKTDMDADYAQVKEQSGFFMNSTDLQVEGKGTFEGGAFLTNSKDDNQAVFKQGITTTDINNRSRYEGESISGGITVGGSTANPQVSSQGIGYGTDGDSQTSTTYGAVTGMAGKFEVTTDNRESLNETLDNTFDADKVGEELGAQVDITQTFDQERRKFKTELNDKEKKLRDAAEAAEAKGDWTTRDQLLDQANKVQDQALLFDSITGALYAPNSNGATGYAAKAVSPYMSNQIGQYFKTNEALNDLDDGDRAEQSSAQHLLAHAILGGAVSYATGNDALTGGLSAGAGEATAPLLMAYLYETDDPDELTAEQKDTISVITGFVGSTIGATTGNVTDAVNAGETSKVAVEGNGMSDMRVDKSLGREGQSPLSNAEALIIKDVLGVALPPVGMLDAYYNAKTEEEKLLVLAEFMTAGKASILHNRIKKLKTQQSNSSMDRSPSGRPAQAKTCSFRGDMLVKTITGYKPIADIAVGDYVFTRNEYTGTTNYQQVSNQYNNQYEQTVYITVRDKVGNTQTIVSNKIHPFFTQITDGSTPPPSSEGHDYQGNIGNAQWVDASNLRAGYRLLSENGKWQVVQSVRQTNEPLSAYNLTVNNDHTYFVTGSDSSYGIWVHNDCWNNLPNNAVATGKTTPDGRKLYTFKDDSGKQVTVYKGTDGRYYDPKVYPPTQPTATGVKAVDDFPNRNGAKAAPGHVYYQNNAEAFEAAKKLGFTIKTSQIIKGEAVFYNPRTKKYITVDVGNGRNNGGAHNGGVWKMATSVERLANKETRLGTFDANLNKIGD